MNGTDQSRHREVRWALKDLRTRVAASLRAFNDAIPHASWLRRSEIERFTVDLLSAAERPPQRHRATSFGKITNAYSWITQARTIGKNDGALPLKRPDLNRQQEERKGMCP
jgi:hypothetical protein